MAKQKRKIYYFWGWEYDHYPTDLERGLHMLAAIIFFPFWIIPYILLRIVQEIGKIKKPRFVKEVEIEEYEDYY